MSSEAALTKKERDRAYYLANREKIIERVKARDAVMKEARKRYNAKYKAQNAERIRAQNAARYERNKEAEQEKHRSWHHANRDRVREYKQRRAKERPDLIKASKLKVYGLTLEDYRSMIEAQDGKCAICRKDFQPGKLTGPHVDHCHSTGEVRELLCRSCNSILGYADENPDTLVAAADYIRRHSARIQAA